MKKTFEGIKVYYSGSIKGMPEADPEFPKNLVKYMSENGAEVLSEHVAGRNQQECDEMMVKKIGITIEEFKAEKEPWFRVRKLDIDWVDEADCVVALVNSPSLGVGMELQRAVDKEKLGMKKTPILCLVRDDLKDKLSFMVSGINADESDVFYLRAYKNLEEAQKHIFDFLTIID